MLMPVFGKIKVSALFFRLHFPKSGVKFYLSGNLDTWYLLAWMIPSFLFHFC